MDYPAEDIRSNSSLSQPFIEKTLPVWECGNCKKECLTVTEQSFCICNHRLNKHSYDTTSEKWQCSERSCKCTDYFYIVAQGLKKKPDQFRAELRLQALGKLNVHASMHIMSTQRIHSCVNIGFATNQDQRRVPVKGLFHPGSVIVVVRGKITSNEQSQSDSPRCLHTRNQYSMDCRTTHPRIDRTLHCHLQPQDHNENDV